MKSFTDIEQSKKLAEILPIESADMWYAEIYEGKIDGWNYVVSDTPYYSLSFTKPSENNYSQNTVKDIPCWSLAALLDVLDYPQLSKDKIGEGKVGWMVSVYPDNCRYDSIWYDNPIDACYEMIIKLKEEGVI